MEILDGVQSEEEYGDEGEEEMLINEKSVTDVGGDEDESEEAPPSESLEIEEEAQEDIGEFEEDEYERLAQIRRENEHKKDEFRDKMEEYLEDEGERDKMVENFDEKVRYINDMLKNEAKHQEDSLEQRLQARKNKRKAQQAAIDAKNAENLEKLGKMEREKE